MTDRHAGYLITLADDIREDSDQAVITALRMVKGVLAVEPVPATYELVIAKQRVDREWRKRILDLLDDNPAR